MILRQRIGGWLASSCIIASVPLSISCNNGNVAPVNLQQQRGQDDPFNFQAQPNVQPQAPDPFLGPLNEKKTSQP